MEARFVWFLTKTAFQLLRRAVDGNMLLPLHAAEAKPFLSRQLAPFRNCLCCQKRRALLQPMSIRANSHFAFTGSGFCALGGDFATALLNILGPFETWAGAIFTMFFSFPLDVGFDVKPLDFRIYASSCKSSIMSKKPILCSSSIFMILFYFL